MKKASELTPGDRVKTLDGTIATITSANRCTWIRFADGPHYDVQWKLPNGETGHILEHADSEIDVLP